MSSLKPTWSSSLGKLVAPSPPTTRYRSPCAPGLGSTSASAPAGGGGGFAKSAEKPEMGEICSTTSYFPPCQGWSMSPASPARRSSWASAIMRYRICLPVVGPTKYWMLSGSLWFSGKEFKTCAHRVARSRGEPVTKTMSACRRGLALRCWCRSHKDASSSISSPTSVSTSMRGRSSSMTGSCTGTALTLVVNSEFSVWELHQPNMLFQLSP
mmetsp:Transcript_49942/g.119147  ORF Transcript_49942/g.119147 Transcript_49942/m.119147 type:complete len:212 (-) Transcript_49942:222-857(-)